MIKYVTGDLFEDIGQEVVICHVVNNIHAWGSGFVVPLGKKYPKSKECYLNWKDIKLGDTQFVLGEDNSVIVANMCAQNGISNYSRTKNVRPLNYGALASCMEDVAERIFEEDVFYDSKLSIKAPLFGSALAGGDWNIIEELIEYIWKDIDVTIYQLPGQEIR
jgi:hypothetical protein